MTSPLWKTLMLLDLIILSVGRLGPANAHKKVTPARPE
jgi:hypothetical protein